jgi:hypothetical protein
MVDVRVLGERVARRGDDVFKEKVVEKERCRQDPLRKSTWVVTAVTAIEFSASFPPIRIRLSTSRVVVCITSNIPDASCQYQDGEGQSSSVSSFLVLG